MYFGKVEKGKLYLRIKEQTASPKAQIQYDNMKNAQGQSSPSEVLKSETIKQGKAFNR